MKIIEYCNIEIPFWVFAFAFGFVAGIFSGIAYNWLFLLVSILFPFLLLYLFKLLLDGQII